MSSHASIFATVKGVTEEDFIDLIYEPFDCPNFHAANILELFDTKDYEYFDGVGQIISDGAVRWNPFDLLPLLISVTQKYPDALISFRLVWDEAEMDDDVAVTYYYFKNGSYFCPKITLSIEEYAEDKLIPIKGSFYENFMKDGEESEDD